MKALKKFLGISRTLLGYIRISGDRKSKEASFDTQESAIRKYAKENGYTHVEIIREVFSGAFLLEAPLFNECREKVRSGRYDAFIAFNMDRLTRDQGQLFIFNRECEKSNTELLFATQKFDKTPEGKLLFGVAAYVAEIEKVTIRDRMQNGRRARLKEGKLVKSAISLYGYLTNKETGKRDVIEAAAATVRRIFDWYVNFGYSMNHIAALLNEEDIPSPATGKNIKYKDTQRYRSTIERGGKSIWRTSSIARILKNRAYIGETVALTHSSTYTWEGPKRIATVTAKPESEWVRLPEGTTPAIVSKDLFDRAQLRLNSNEKTSRTKSEARPSLLRDLIFCKCGAKMHPGWKKPSPDRSRPGYVVYSYRCMARNAGETCDYEGTYVNGDKIELAVWNKIMEVWENPEIIRKSIADRRNLSVAARRKLEANVASIQGSVDDLNQEIKNMAENIAKMPSSVFAIVNKELTSNTKKRDRMLEILKDKKSELETFDDDIAQLAYLEEHGEQVAKDMKSYEWQQKRVMLKGMGARVTGTRGFRKLSLSIPENMESVLSSDPKNRKSFNTCEIVGQTGKPINISFDLVVV